MKSRYLQDGYLYTTCEPCPMCAAAAVFAKMAGIIYGVSQPDAIHHASLRKENSQSWRQLAVRTAYILERGTPKLELYPDVLREECLSLFQYHLWSVVRLAADCPAHVPFDGSSQLVTVCRRDEPYISSIPKVGFFTSSQSTGLPRMGSPANLLDMTERF
ncbi:MAG: hypothetical protein J2P37_29060 [Ktedonobacteraceae bacterium]|nr:hypothetical protein [Ktedonobacteraceae bacterium]